MYKLSDFQQVFWFCSFNISISVPHVSEHVKVTKLSQSKSPECHAVVVDSFSKIKNALEVLYGDTTG